MGMKQRRCPSCGKRRAFDPDRRCGAGQRKYSYSTWGVVDGVLVCQQCFRPHFFEAMAAIKDKEQPDRELTEEDLRIFLLDRDWRHWLRTYGTAMVKVLEAGAMQLGQSVEEAYRAGWRAGASSIHVRREGDRLVLSHPCPQDGVRLPLAPPGMRWVVSAEPLGFGMVIALVPREKVEEQP